MSETGRRNSHLAMRLLRKTPLRFVCAWSQEVNLQPCPRHDHPVLELVYHPNGRGVSHLGDGTALHYREGTVVLYSAHVAHDQYAEEAGTDVCVHLKLPRQVAALLPSAKVFEPTPDTFIHEAFWSLSRTPPNPGPLAAAVLDIRVTALLLELIVASTQPRTSQDHQTALVEQALLFLQNNFASLPDVGTVARHVGVSEDYLRHLFKEKKGISLNQALTYLRIERAKTLLRHSRLPLKSIASQCGFQNDRYFCTRFAALTGMTPGTFRNQPHGATPPPL
jgi:AraC-like DNA-binding protein